MTSLPKVTISVSPDDAAIALALRTFPVSSLNIEVTKVPAGTVPVTNLDGKEFPGYDTALKFIGLRAFPQDKFEYTTIERAVIHDWVSMTAKASLEADTPRVLRCLNEHLHNKTYILTDKISIADVAVYARLKDIVAKLSPEEMVGTDGSEEGGLRHVVRYFDFVQNSPELGLKLTEAEKIKFDLDLVKKAGAKIRGPFVCKELGAWQQLEKDISDYKAAKEAKRVATAAAAEAAPKKNTKKQKSGKKDGDKSAEGAEGTEGAPAAEQTKKDVVVSTEQVLTNRKDKKKEKKEKNPQKAQPAKKEDAPLSPIQIDFRVGQILHCQNHPDADGLYVSTISCNDPADSPYITALPSPYCPAEKIPEGVNVRTVCSGLRRFVPLEEMQGRRVVLVCNLKPAKMRGISSAAMVLAASPRPVEGEEKDIVELVTPPPDAEIGEQLVFEGYEEGDVLPQLPPKKKIMEQITPGLCTDVNKIVVFDGTEVAALEKKVVGKLVRQGKGEAGGLCSVKTLALALVK